MLFTSLYLGEGLYQTVLVLITPLYLLEKNVPIPIITLVVGIGQLPWALKFVWGGIIDFYHKFGRKKFTVFGIIIGAIGFIILGLTDQFFSVILYAILLFIGHMGIGFLDAAADAWAIDISTKEDRGKINAFMNIGTSFSGAVGGPVFVVVGISFGYNIAFILTGILVLISAIVPLLVKYTDTKIDKLDIWRLIKQEFRKKPTQLTSLYFVLSILNPGLLTALVVLFAKTILLWEDTFIAFTGVLVLFIGTIPGSIIGGVMADRIGRKKTLFIFLFITLFWTVQPIFLVTVETVVLLPVYIVLSWTILMNFAWSGTTAANWAMVMDIINPKIGSVQHEIMCSIGNFGDSVISAAAGTILILIGISNIFLLASTIVIASFGLLYHVHSEKIR